MKNHSQKFPKRLAMLKRWKESGKSIKAFCKDENIVNSTFHYWYRKLNKGKKKFPESTFIKLNPGSPPVVSNLFCELFTANGSRLIFHQPVEGSFLKKIL